MNLYELEAEARAASILRDRVARLEEELAEWQQAKAAARAAVEAWWVWRDAEGWDNAEYDGLADALFRLGKELGMEEGRKS